ncbi:hypothetical protein NUK55_21815, partial [Aeromonas veronii]|uniref:hypothetical protein n=1 Tax=Aeromonas veronii TaxID=654 RepID=UPI00214D9D93
EYKITPCSVGQILVPCLKNVRDLALPLLDLPATHIGHRQACLEYELTRRPKKSQSCQPQQ